MLFVVEFRKIRKKIDDFYPILYFFFDKMINFNFALKLIFILIQNDFFLLLFYFFECRTRWLRATYYTVGCPFK